MKRYIDADKLKESFNASVTDIHHADFPLDLIWEYIDEQPVEDVRENIKGEWQTVLIGCDTNEIRCTACKKITSVPTSITKKLNFCPECGADMRDWDMDLQF